MNFNGKINHFFQEHFDLTSDLENRYLSIDRIKSNVVFKGTNLWILIFATFIASIGLNMNSTAVIIGAMLISPLMGPIIGIGLGVGILDIELIKKAFRNLLLAVTFSIVVSTAYFILTPINEASSELLARTHPTIWDVFIALFGGLSGVIASTRKEKNNVIPGVAIATALMPPLCTVGYGIAISNYYIALGAFYLFLINSVFISFSTFLMIRFLNYPKVIKNSIIHNLYINRYIVLSILFTVIPSIYLGYSIVKQEISSQKISRILTEELNTRSHHILQQKISYQFDTTLIEVSLIGLPIDSVKENELEEKIKDIYSSKIKLITYQSKDKSNFKNKLIGYEKTMSFQSEVINRLNLRIEILEAQLKDSIIPLEKILDEQLLKEIKIIDPTVISIAITPVCNQNKNTIVIKHKIQPTKTSKLDSWLKVRYNTSDIDIVHYK